LGGVGLVMSCIDQPEPHLLRAAIARGLAYTDIAPHLMTRRPTERDPHPPYGSMDYDHLGAMSAVRAGLSLAAPVIAAKPKRLTKQNR
jgi:hypothetical protein